MFFCFKKCAFCFQIRYDCFSCLITIHTGIFWIIFYNLSIIGQDIDHFKIMTQSHLKIVRIMCRSDFYNTGTKFHIYIIICDDRNLTVYDRQI